MEQTDINEYKLEKQDVDAKSKADQENDLPMYYERLTLDEAQKVRLVKEMEKEVDEIVDERTSCQFDEESDALDGQYDGTLQEDVRRHFNLCKNVTKVKVNIITNMIMQALMKSDPKFSVSPRPEFMKEGGRDVCDKQGDFIDNKLDDLQFRAPVEKAVRCGVLKGTGWLKMFHRIKREDKQRDEEYDGGKIVPVINPETKKVVVDPETGAPQMKNKGLEEFLQNWPDAEEKYPRYVERLKANKKVSITAKYKETTYNDPGFKFVGLKDLYVRKGVDGAEGLKTTRLVEERYELTWWELKQMEKENGYIYDIDELRYEKGADGKYSKEKDGYENRTYEIAESIFYFRLKEDSDEEVKIVCWRGVERKAIIGSIMYPYYSIGCYYFPLHVKNNVNGIYQPGVGGDLTDSQIAESSLLNFTLDGAYMNNMITPIAEEDSDVYNQIVERRWAHGVPLAAKPGEVDFLQKYMKPVDINGMLLLLEYLSRGDDDLSGVSGLMTGGESKLDPRAPASKTLALLRQSGIHIESYVEAIAPSFNNIGRAILDMYYQISKEGRKYKPRSENAVGDDPFATIERNEMIARTTLQVQATAFDFDKQSEKGELLAYYQLVRGEPLFSRNPKAIYTLLKNISKSWSPMVRNLIDQMFPSLEDFKQEQVKIALQALQQYLQAKQQDQQVTGAAPELNSEEFMVFMNDMIAQAYTPPDEKAIKEAQKKQEKVNA